MTVRELSEAANVSIGKAHIILTTTLNMRKEFNSFHFSLTTIFYKQKNSSKSITIDYVVDVVEQITPWAGSAIVCVFKSPSCYVGETYIFDIYKRSRE